MSEQSNEITRLQLGYVILLNDHSGVGGTWRQLEVLFPNSNDASKYREEHYPDVQKWSIKGIRQLNIQETVESGDNSKGRKLHALK